MSALLHVARTVCRRAEREVLRLMRDEDVGEWPLAYLNRLSDLLFVLSRWIGHHLRRAGVPLGAAARARGGARAARRKAPDA